MQQNLDTIMTTIWSACQLHLTNQSQSNMRRNNKLIELIDLRAALLRDLF